MSDSRVLDILKQVEAGDLTPEEADRALGELGIGDAFEASPAVPAAPATWSLSPPSRSDRARARRDRQRERLERRLEHHQRRRERLHQRLGASYTVDHLIRLRLHGISPDFIEEMREAGYDNLSPEELAELRIHGVTPDYVTEMRELLGDVPVEKMTELRIHGVTPELVQELHEAGVASATPDDVLRWRHSTRGSRFSDAVNTAVEAVGPHVTQLVEAALTDARRRIYDALRVQPTAPEEWRSVDVRPEPPEASPDR